MTVRFETESGDLVAETDQVDATDLLPGGQLIKKHNGDAYLCHHWIERDGEKVPVYRFYLSADGKNLFWTAPQAGQ